MSVEAARAICQEAHALPGRSSLLAGKSAWGAVASLLNLAGRLMAGIIIAPMLGTHGAGRIAYLVWITDTANVLMNLGLQNSLTRFLAESAGRTGAQSTRALAASV